MSRCRWQCLLPFRRVANTPNLKQGLNNKTPLISKLQNALAILFRTPKQFRAVRNNFGLQRKQVSKFVLIALILDGCTRIAETRYFKLVHGLGHISRAAQAVPIDFQHVTDVCIRLHPEKSNLLFVFKVLSFAKLRNHLSVNNQLVGLGVQLILLDTVLEHALNVVEIVYRLFGRNIEVSLPSFPVSHKLFVISLKNHFQILDNLTISAQ
jgi:hypothetical protein